MNSAKPVVRAVPDLRNPLRDAIAAIARLTAEVAKLRLDIVERDHHIATLREMLERAVNQ